jgi:hypothetical protein
MTAAAKLTVEDIEEVIGPIEDLAHNCHGVLGLGV